MNFPDFWATYPHPKNRGSKAQAEKLFGRLSLGQRTRMEAGLPRYMAHCQDTEWYQPMQAQRWLNPKAENWDAWAEAAPGQDADLETIKREHEKIQERNRLRQEAADEQWRDRYEKQFGYRPS